MTEQQEKKHTSHLALALTGEPCPLRALFAFVPGPSPLPLSPRTRVCSPPAGSAPRQSDRTKSVSRWPSAFRTVWLKPPSHRASKGNSFALSVAQGHLTQSAKQKSVLKPNFYGCDAQSARQESSSAAPQRSACAPSKMCFSLGEMHFSPGAHTSAASRPRSCRRMVKKVSPEPWRCCLFAWQQPLLQEKTRNPK